MTRPVCPDTALLSKSCDACISCETCFTACCTFEATGNPESTPMNRLAIIHRLLSGEAVLEEDIRNIYTCTECGRCDTVCPMEIPISETIAEGKVPMVAMGFGPLPRHNDMIAAIFAKGNAVNKDAATRLDWLPAEERPLAPLERPCDTLLYMGCMASWVDKATARACYFLLKKAGVAFTLMEDEFCCGIYPYNAGKREEARSIFTSMQKKFAELGISRIIVPCAGCHRTFSTYYPRMLTDFTIQTVHISEFLLTLIEEKRLTFTPVSRTITFHDSCKLGRKSGIYEAPRKLLQHMGYRLKELPENRENSRCCGAGAGVRSFAADLSMDISQQLLADIHETLLVTTCPFCIFNLGYTAKKKGQNLHISHIASLACEQLAP
ncbi:(Fe-S)-binding protein [Desulfobotulus sp. H1]|uniref:(Fe-S)-binding protein n=1 Tax=Desulfobotulus pelophilus TaxID=2823377 RepID=A0ABT3N5H2_9BACT|nr:(Fe-S)-binding protein [Desulfobotulus pelophilus]MCW7752704.1 (Fe-S)-binding protein [Desulfobotulus pelophilus]